MPLALEVTVRWWWWLILVPLGWFTIAVAVAPSSAHGSTAEEGSDMPREVRDPDASDRAVFSVPVVLRDRDLAEVRNYLEHNPVDGRGRGLAWYEVIEYLYRYWKDTEMSRP